VQSSSVGFIVRSTVVTHADLADAAQLSSLADEPPRSFVVVDAKDARARERTTRPSPRFLGGISADDPDVWRGISTDGSPQGAATR